VRNKLLDCWAIWRLVGLPELRFLPSAGSNGLHPLWRRPLAATIRPA